MIPVTQVTMTVYCRTADEPEIRQSLRAWFFDNELTLSDLDIRTQYIPSPPKGVTEAFQQDERTP